MWFSQRNYILSLHLQTWGQVIQHSQPHLLSEETVGCRDTQMERDMKLLTLLVMELILVDHLIIFESTETQAAGTEDLS